MRYLLLLTACCSGAVLHLAGFIRCVMCAACQCQGGSSEAAACPAIRCSPTTGAATLMRTWHAHRRWAMPSSSAPPCHGPFAHCSTLVRTGQQFIVGTRSPHRVCHLHDHGSLLCAYSARHSGKALTAMHYAPCPYHCRSARDLPPGPAAGGAAGAHAVGDALASGPPGG